MRTLEKLKAYKFMIKKLYTRATYFLHYPFSISANSLRFHKIHYDIKTLGEEKIAYRRRRRCSEELGTAEEDRAMRC